MSRAPEPARTVKVEIPAEAFQHRPWDPAEVAHEMRVLWLLEEVRARRLGFGKAAELAGVPNDDTWVQWRAVVDVDPGDHMVQVRATDKDGLVQTGEVQDVVPDGATGWHSVDFSAQG